MSYGLNKTLKMCTVKIEIELGYIILSKSESKSKSSKNGLESGLEYCKSVGAFSQPGFRVLLSSDAMFMLSAVFRARDTYCCCWGGRRDCKEPQRSGIFRKYFF